jgi:hypothetical protein
MTGDQDWIYKTGVKRIVAENSKHLVLHRIPSAGHHLYLDQPELFNALVRKTLEDGLAPGNREEPDVWTSNPSFENLVVLDKAVNDKNYVNGLKSNAACFSSVLGQREDNDFLALR